MTVLVLDFDGTLVESFTARPLPGAVRALAASDSDVPIAVITNQGGPAFRITSSTRHPSPSEVADNLDQGLRACGLTPSRLSHLLVATWPGERWRGAPADGLEAARIAAMQVNAALRQRGWAQAYATASPGWRTPAPGMLQALAVQLLVPISSILSIGDMASDQAAAQAAGVRFCWAKDWWR